MELKKYIWLAALPMIFTACQEDILVKDSSNQGITMLTATMGEQNPDSRAQIELGGTDAGNFMWNEGDAFTLFEFFNDDRPGPENREFSINDDYEDTNPSASADFSLCEESQALTPDNYFAAIYPSVDNSDANIQLLNAEIGTNIVPCVFMSIQKPPYAMNQLGGNNDKEKDANYWKAYFKNNMFMKTSKIEKIQSSNTKVNFEHLCGLVRISYTNAHSTNVVIKEIRLNGNWQTQIYLDKGTFNIIEEYPQTVEGLSFNSDEFNCSIAPGETRDFYLLFFPIAATNVTNISITYVPGSDATEEETVNLSNYKDNKLNISGFEAGKTYWFRITEIGNEQGEYNLQWTAELEGGNEEEGDQPGDNKPVIDTFDKLKNAINAPQQSEITSIRLASDITLTEQLVINKPIQLIMDGHTLTLGYTLQEKEGAIINNSDLYITKEGTIKAPSTGTEVDAYLIKSGAGKVDLRYVTIDAGIVKNAVYIKDGTGLVYETATINASGYTLDIESDSYSDVDIYTGTLNGDVRWKLNSAQYTKQCRFGAGPQSTINGNLVWAGEYGGKAEGYKIEFGSPVYIDGENWPSQGNAGGGNSENEEGVSNYEELISALSNSNITRISFASDIAIEAPLEITHTVQLNLNKHRMTINTDNFQGGALANVIEVKNDGITFYLDNGVVDFTGYKGKMNSCIRTSGNNIQLNMADIDITLGNNFGPAIWLDDDNLRIESGYKTPTITATTAIIYDSRTLGEHKSTIKANINGNVEFVSATNIGLNTTFEFLSGCINGALNIGNGISDDVNIANHVKFKKGVVTFGENASDGNASGWSKAGMINDGESEGGSDVKSVTNCGDLIKALQSSEELIRIGADFDITLELDFDFEGHKEIKMQGHTLRAGFTGFKNLITNRGNLSISGGTIEGEAGGNLFYNAPSSQLELRGVSIVGRGAEQAIHLHRSSCTITDLSGEISSINMDGKTAIMNSESTLTIESGNITGMVRNYQNGKITIKAGTINGNLDFPETDSANQSASITIAKDGVTLIGTGWDDERINRN